MGTDLHTLQPSPIMPVKVLVSWSRSRYVHGMLLSQAKQSLLHASTVRFAGGGSALLFEFCRDKCQFMKIWVFALGFAVIDNLPR